MDINILVIVSSVITALATGVIAIYTFKSYAVYAQLKTLEVKRQEDDGKRQQEIKDLYQAIVISNLIPTLQDDPRIAIQRFKDNYKGKTQIF